MRNESTERIIERLTPPAKIRGEVSSPLSLALYRASLTATRHCYRLYEPNIRFNRITQTVTLAHALVEIDVKLPESFLSSLGATLSTLITRREIAICAMAAASAANFLHKIDPNKYASTIQRLTETILKHQNPDGGWGVHRMLASGVPATGMILKNLLNSYEIERKPSDRLSKAFDLGFRFLNEQWDKELSELGGLTYKAAAYLLAMAEKYSISKKLS